MILKRLVATNGKYTTSDGQEKNRYVTIGQLHEHEERQYITLDAHINLAGLIRKEGETRVFVSLYDNDEQGQKPQQRQAQQTRPAALKQQFVDDDLDSSIPF